MLRKPVILIIHESHKLYLYKVIVCICILLMTKPASKNCRSKHVQLLKKLRNNNVRLTNLVNAGKFYY